MTNQEIAERIRFKLFADRETLTEALDYAFSVFRSLGPNEMAATTAMMVVLNTVAKELIKGEKE
jgi:hypothetical protein